MDAEANRKIYFEEFELDPEKRRLVKNGETVGLNAKAFDLLLFLAENSGRVVTKEEILDKVWAGQFVEEANLTVQISALRKALGESKDAPRFLLTLPRKGYKFVARVNSAFDEELIIESRQISHLILEEKIASEPESNIGQLTGGKNKFGRNKSKSNSLIFLSSVAALLVVGLTAFYFWRSDAARRESKQLKINRQTTGGKIANMTVTPDGKYAIFAKNENDGQSLWLRHLSTGSETPVMPARQIVYAGLAISPDGNFIYASVFIENQPDTPLWKIPLLGGAPEEIRGIIAGAAVSFSPDGKQFAFTQSRSDLKQTQLVVADADGTNLRTLIAAENDKRAFYTYGANPVAWSPDGREIACAVEEKNEKGSKARILLVNPSDKSHRFLVAPVWNRLENLVWLDKETLAFTGRAENPSNQVWLAARKNGEVRQTTNDLHNYSWIAAGAGVLLTVQANALTGIKIADFQENSERLDLKEIHSEAMIRNVAFAPDGSILLSSAATGKNEIWRLPREEKSPVQLTSGANISYGLAVSPASGELVFTARENGSHLLKRADASGKNIETLTDGAEDLWATVSADGKTLVFQRDYYDPRAWRLNLSDKTPLQLTKIKSQFPVISPDGKLAAYFFMDFSGGAVWRIGLISTETAETAGKLDLPVQINERRMCWHPNGKFLSIVFYTGEIANLLLLPVDGGKPRTIENLGKGEIQSFAWSPDGKRVVFAQTLETSDIVSLTDF